MTYEPDNEHVEDESFPDSFPPPASPEREDGKGAGPDEGSGRKAPLPVPPKRTGKRNLPKLGTWRFISERASHIKACVS